MPPEAAWPHGWLDAGALAPGVRGLMTTRQGGTSQAPFDTMNLRPAALGGDGVDDPAALAENERRLAEVLRATPVYLDQVHGPNVVRLTRADLPADCTRLALPRADASVTWVPGIACTVLVADCLPVLFARADGRVVAAAHAGWRGMAAGVLERTVAALREPLAGEHAPWAGEVRAWLGACIGPQAFEVGADVLQAFGTDATASPTGHPRFRFAPRPDGSPRWRADLGGLAYERLQAMGVSVPGGGCPPCTVEDPSRFFSFRRDGRTGRMAACIWIDA
jgi:polyphenol oxidase